MNGKRLAVDDLGRVILGPLGHLVEVDVGRYGLRGIRPAHRYGILGDALDGDFGHKLGIHVEGADRRLVGEDLAEADEVDVEIRQQDLRIDVFRSSGPGGQSVNTTDSAVRITHIPTGIVVSCQNEKSQLQNKESALRILRARMLAAAQEEADRIASVARNSQVRSVDRSERIRTYNFPENRLSDHRVNFKANNLDAVLNGELDDVISALLEADKATKLASGDH